MLGGLKVGHKRLFIRDQEGTYSNIKPLCVLDFYVHESCQRQGIGKRLFEVSLVQSTGLTYYFRMHLMLGVLCMVELGPGQSWCRIDTTAANLRCQAMVALPPMSMQTALQSWAGSVQQGRLTATV